MGKVNKQLVPSCDLKSSESGQFAIQGCTTSESLHCYHPLHIYVLLLVLCCLFTTWKFIPVVALPNDYGEDKN